MKIRKGTIIWLGVAAAAVTVTQLDPLGHGRDGPTYVSTQSAATRLFPALADVPPEQLRIVLRPSDGDPVELRPTQPGEQGHVLLVDGHPAGPVDPDAFEGLLASLRMATTLRAVSDASEIGPARRGSITLMWGDEARKITVGGPTPDQVGLYGLLEGEGDAQAWVVETELGEILDQAPQAWLATRAAVVTAGQVLRVDFGDAAVRRGDDGVWRSQVGSTTAMLDTAAVESRIDRLAGARLDPMLPDLLAPSTRPWVVLDATGDRRHTLELGPPCPGHPGRVVVVRGAGWPGCIDEVLTRPWPLPGAVIEGDASAPATSMVEPRLAPHPYGRVLQIIASAPEQRTLRQKLGDWVLLQPQGETTTTTDVSRGRVYAWYELLRDVEVEPDLDAAPLRPDVDLQIVTDSTVLLRLRCELGEPSRCRRDDGPILRVLDPLPPLSLAADTFVDDQLFSFETHDVRAIEIVPGRAGVRQAAHFDLGVWRLDAPVHPQGDQALDETALEAMLATMASARAEAAASMPTGDPLRSIRVELTPVRGRAADAKLDLHDECVAVANGRAVTLAKAACARLEGDLLHSDPLTYWLSTAQSVEVDEEDLQVRLRREGEQWLATQPDAEEDARQRLQELSKRRVEALVAGDPPSSPTGTLRILPSAGGAFRVRYGPGWAAIEEQPWYYRFESATGHQ